MKVPNQRAGGDGGMTLQFHAGRHLSAATQHGRYRTMHRLLPVMALMAIALGCRTVSPSDPVYDNKGGLAYGGVRITFHASGSYEMERYTDVVGDRAIERGSYRKLDSRYLLTHDRIEAVYHVVRVRGVEYLLDGPSLDEYARTKDSAKLHGAMRKTR